MPKRSSSSRLESLLKSLSDDNDFVLKDKDVDFLLKNIQQGKVKELIINNVSIFLTEKESDLKRIADAAYKAGIKKVSLNYIFYYDNRDDYQSGSAYGTQLEQSGSLQSLSDLLLRSEDFYLGGGVLDDNGVNYLLSKLSESKKYNLQNFTLGSGTTVTVDSLVFLTEIAQNIGLQNLVLENVGSYLVDNKDFIKLFKNFFKGGATKQIHLIEPGLFFKDSMKFLKDDKYFGVKKGQEVPVLSLIAKVIQDNAYKKQTRFFYRESENNIENNDREIINRNLRSAGVKVVNYFYNIYRLKTELSFDKKVKFGSINNILDGFDDKKCLSDLNSEELSSVVSYIYELSTFTSKSKNLKDIKVFMPAAGKIINAFNALCDEVPVSSFKDNDLKLLSRILANLSTRLPIKPDLCQQMKQAMLKDQSFCSAFSKFVNIINEKKSLGQLTKDQISKLMYSDVAPLGKKMSRDYIVKNTDTMLKCSDLIIYGGLKKEWNFGNFIWNQKPEIVYIELLLALGSDFLSKLFPDQDIVQQIKDGSILEERKFQVFDKDKKNHVVVNIASYKAYLICAYQYLYSQNKHDFHDEQQIKDVKFNQSQSIAKTFNNNHSGLTAGFFNMFEDLIKNDNLRRLIIQNLFTNQIDFKKEDKSQITNLKVSALLSIFQNFAEAATRNRLGPNVEKANDPLNDNCVTLIDYLVKYGLQKNLAELLSDASAGLLEKNGFTNLGGVLTICNLYNQKKGYNKQNSPFQEIIDNEDKKESYKQDLEHKEKKEVAIVNGLCSELAFKLKFSWDFKTADSAIEGIKYSFIPVVRISKTPRRISRRRSSLSQMSQIFSRKDNKQKDPEIEDIGFNFFDKTEKINCIYELMDIAKNLPDDRNVDIIIPVNNDYSIKSRIKIKSLSKEPEIYNLLESEFDQIIKCFQRVEDKLNPVEKEISDIRRSQIFIKDQNSLKLQSTESMLKLCKDSLIKCIDLSPEKREKELRLILSTIDKDRLISKFFGDIIKDEKLTSNPEIKSLLRSVYLCYCRYFYKYRHGMVVRDNILKEICEVACDENYKDVVYYQKKSIEKNNVNRYFKMVRAALSPFNSSQLFCAIDTIFFDIDDIKTLHSIFKKLKNDLNKEQLQNVYLLVNSAESSLERLKKTKDEDVRKLKNIKSDCFFHILFTEIEKGSNEIYISPITCKYGISRANLKALIAWFTDQPCNIEIDGLVKGPDGKKSIFLSDIFDNLISGSSNKKDMSEKPYSAINMKLRNFEFDNDSVKKLTEFLENNSGYRVTVECCFFSRDVKDKYKFKLFEAIKNDYQKHFQFSTDNFQFKDEYENYIASQKCNKNESKDNDNQFYFQILCDIDQKQTADDINKNMQQITEQENAMSQLRKQKIDECKLQFEDAKLSMDDYISWRNKNINRKVAEQGSNFFNSFCQQIKQKTQKNIMDAKDCVLFLASGGTEVKKEQKEILNKIGFEESGSIVNRPHIIGINIGGDIHWQGIFVNENGTQSEIKTSSTHNICGYDFMGQVFHYCWGNKEFRQDKVRIILQNMPGIDQKTALDFEEKIKNGEICRPDFYNDKTNRQIIRKLMKGLIEFDKRYIHGMQRMDREGDKMIIDYMVAICEIVGVHNIQPRLESQIQDQQKKENYKKIIIDNLIGRNQSKDEFVELGKYLTQEKSLPDNKAQELIEYIKQQAESSKSEFKNLDMQINTLWHKVREDENKIIQSSIYSDFMDDYNFDMLNTNKRSQELFNQYNDKIEIICILEDIEADQICRKLEDAVEEYRQNLIKLHGVDNYDYISFMAVYDANKAIQQSYKEIDTQLLADNDQYEKDINILQKNRTKPKDIKHNSDSALVIKSPDSKINSQKGAIVKNNIALQRSRSYSS